MSGRPSRPFSAIQSGSMFLKSRCPSFHLQEANVCFLTLYPLKSLIEPVQALKSRLPEPERPIRTVMPSDGNAAFIPLTAFLP